MSNEIPVCGRCGKDSPNGMYCQECAPLRRRDINCHTEAEIAITAAMAIVEKLPADERLTDAVILLDHARESVADYVDGWPRVPRGESLVTTPPSEEMGLQCNHCGHRYKGLTALCPKCGKTTAQKTARL